MSILSMFSEGQFHLPEVYLDSILDEKSINKVGWQILYRSEDK